MQSILKSKSNSNLFRSNDKLEGDILGENEKKETICFDLQFNKLINAYDLMYGESKGHDVCSPQEAILKIRSEIDQATKEGLLKSSLSHNVLLDIRHNQLVLEETKERIISEVDQKFNDVINQIKQRKMEVLKDIDDHFETQAQNLQAHEEIWIQKEDIQKELLTYAKGNDDNLIIKNAQFIKDGFESLKQEKKFQKVELYHNMDFTFNAKNETQQITLSLKELLQSIGQFCKNGETINIQFKA